MSEDGRHVLIIAKIKGSGTDTAVAARIQKTIDESGRELNADKSLSGDKYTITAAGAYRAALDNETIAKHDTRLALNPDHTGHRSVTDFRFSPSAHRPFGAAAFDGRNDRRSFRLLLFI